MKITQIQLKEPIFIEATHAQLSGTVAFTGSQMKFPGMSAEIEPNAGVRIKIGKGIIIVPWAQLKSVNGIDDTPAPVVAVKCDAV